MTIITKKRLIAAGVLSALIAEQYGNGSGCPGWSAAGREANPGT